MISGMRFLVRLFPIAGWLFLSISPSFAVQTASPSLLCAALLEGKSSCKIEHCPTNFENYTPKQLLPFENAIKAINRALSPHFDIPGLVRIEINNLQGAVLHDYARTISVGIKSVGSTGRPSTQTSLAILAHEYGHLLLRENEAAGISFRKIDYYLRERSSLAWKIRAGSKQAENELNRLDEKNVRFVALGKSLKREFGDEYELPPLLEAYDELFADAISLLFTKNPKAISSYCLNFNEKTALFRDFSHDPDLRSVNKYYLHGYFSKVRYLFWEKYFSNPKFVHFRPQLTRALFDAIIADFNKRIDSGQVELGTVKDDNQRLQNELRSQIGLILGK